MWERGRDVFELLAQDLYMFHWEDYWACCVVADGLLIESQPEASARELLHAVQNGIAHVLNGVSGCDMSLNNKSLSRFA